MVEARNVEQEDVLRRLEGMAHFQSAHLNIDGVVHLSAQENAIRWNLIIFTLVQVYGEKPLIAHQMALGSVPRIRRLYGPTCGKQDGLDDLQLLATASVYHVRIRNSTSIPGLPCDALVVPRGHFIPMVACASCYCHICCTWRLAAGLPGWKCYDYALDVTITEYFVGIQRMMRTYAVQCLKPVQLCWQVEYVLLFKCVHVRLTGPDFFMARSKAGKKQRHQRIKQCISSDLKIWIRARMQACSISSGMYVCSSKMNCETAERRM